MSPDPTDFVGFEPVQLNNLMQRESRFKKQQGIMFISHASIFSFDIIRR